MIAKTKAFELVAAGVLVLAWVLTGRFLEQLGAGSELPIDGLIYLGLGALAIVAGVAVAMNREARLAGELSWGSTPGWATLLQYGACLVVGGFLLEDAVGALGELGTARGGARIAIAGALIALALWRGGVVLVRSRRSKAATSR